VFLLTLARPVFLLPHHPPFFSLHSHAVLSSIATGVATETKGIANRRRKPIHIDTGNYISINIYAYIYIHIYIYIYINIFMYMYIYIYIYMYI